MCPLNHETYRNSDAKRTHAYDANGNMLQEKENNVVQNAYTYDELNQLLTATDKNGATTTYTYDANNNISSKTIAHASSDIYTANYAGTSETYSNITSHTQTMEYDSGNRMTNRYETITGTSNGSAKTATYRTMYSYTGGGGLSFKREITDATYRDKTYQYNARNQLIAYREHYVLKASYTYDAEGYRSSKTVDGTTTKFYWDRGYTSNESDGTNFTAKNTIGINGIIARKTGSQTPVYLMKDVHGDTTALLRSNSQVGTYDYDEYGNLTDSTGTIDNPYRYCGEYADSETGFIYLRNRYYSPELGRFTSEDPAKDGDNWYAYCNNNPVKYTDPWGLVAGEHFATLKELANDWAWNWFADSDFIMIELGSIIYTVVGSDGKTYYTYTEPIFDEPHNINFDKLYGAYPEDKYVGAIHAHPQGGGLSQQDKNYADSHNGVIYAVEFNSGDGKIKIFGYGAGGATVTINDNTPILYLNDGQRQWMYDNYSNYRNVWEKHKSACEANNALTCKHWMDWKPDIWKRAQDRRKR